MDQKLKQRLVGAIVLISLAVVFIPIILEGPDDEWTPRSHSTPEPPQMDYGAPLELPVPVEELAAVNPPSIPAPAEIELEAEVEAEAVTETDTETESGLETESGGEAIAVTVETPAAPVITAPPATPADPVPADSVVADTPSRQARIESPAPPEVNTPPGSTAKLPDGGWVIQVGSFSSERNANSLRERLRSSGYDSALQDIAVRSGRMYRVVVGPHQERETAERLREKLENEMQLRGIVVENKR